jgi:hypothetical protein
MLLPDARDKRHELNTLWPQCVLDAKNWLRRFEPHPYFPMTGSHLTGVSQTESALSIAAPTHYGFCF